MDAQFDELLCKRYPEIFRDRYGSMQQTAMCWGFACGNGWFPLIDTLCAEIQRHVEFARVQPVVAVQVKEKFGALRFYISGGDAYTRGSSGLQMHSRLSSAKTAVRLHSVRAAVGS